MGLLIAIILGLFFLPIAVSAHVLETQGSLGAVLHIDPDDSPIAGEPSGIFFEFKDKANRFKLENCNCHLIIERANSKIYDQVFTTASGGSFTFPAQDVYSVKAVGSPKTGNVFEPFELSYSIRVERGLTDAAVSGPSPKKTVPILIIGIVLLFGSLFAVRYLVIKRNA